MKSTNRYRVYNWNVAFSLSFILLWISAMMVNGQCPWPRTPLHVSLHSDCVCGYSNVRRLSVQCSPMANFSQLLEVLNSPSVQRLPIDLLYINNATGLSVLPKNAFKKLDIQQIHLTNTFLERIDKDAFAGLEDKLNSLTLQNTGLKEVPTPIKLLRSLRTLDLSNNRIRRIRPRTFEDLGQLTTLRLAFNNDIQLDREAFTGLGRTLKNLNLKGINLKHIPEAIFNLTELAFLDLAQNKIEEIKPRMFRNHHLLTALSLERNLIRSMHPDTFVGLNDSLSSLSLLNNMLIEFPLLALSKLTGLRVLDLGFNAIRQLPEQAFRSNELLTLLALDGNPLKTLSFQTFKHLNNSLRGLSVGGKFFECDCKVRWLAEWAMEYSLQITSRERNPQFCAKPAHLRSKPFTHIHLDDFVCPPLLTTTTTTTTTSTSESPIKPSNPTMTTTVTTTASSSTTSTSHISSQEINNNQSPPSPSPPATTTQIVKSATGFVQVVPVNENENNKVEPTFKTTINTNKQQATLPTINKDNVKFIKTSTGRSNIGQVTGPPSLKLTDVHYRNGSVILRWEVLKASNSGYQILYRYFGSKEFYRSDPLNANSNSYTVDKFIAPNELIIICVINLDDSDDSVNYDEEGEQIIPQGQCKELSTREPIIKKTMLNIPTSRTTPTTTLSSFYPSLKRLNDIDKIVIGISAAVCVFIIIAVLIFSCCFYRSSSKDSPLRTLTTNAACLSTKSLSPLAKSNFDHEWETVSMYSTRSIPRARIANTGLTQPSTITHGDTLRSQVSNTGYIHPVSRYLGATLPPPHKTVRSPWLESYLHHYPSVNHLPAISYGTTVTANGSGYHNHNLDSFSGQPVERSKSHRHASRPKSSSKSRQQHPNQRPHSKSHIDLRSNAGSNGSNGSSTNRLLLSSTSNTSNSYQSQNDYDSDHNHHWNNTSSVVISGQQYRSTTPKMTSSNSHTHLAVPTIISTTTTGHRGTNTNLMNNDNEVDIYIDQNYAKRFY